MLSRRRVSILLAVLAAAVGVAVTVARRPAAPPAVARVTRVVDGDTIVADGRYVRLIGIDTPETVDPHRPVGCFGPQASAFTKHLLTGRTVELRYDRELHDRYGRLLAYVYLPGPSPTFVNAVLVARGYARTLVFAPNTAHEAQLARLERAAAARGAGLWSACA
jgi:micrococcal nuclease